LPIRSAAADRTGRTAAPTGPAPGRPPGAGPGGRLRCRVTASAGAAGTGGRSVDLVHEARARPARAWDPQLVQHVAHGARTTRRARRAEPGDRPSRARFAAG